MTGTLVGPLPTVRFQDGSVIAYTPPRDTCDPRYAACTEHRVACDCREAERAEESHEWRSADRDVRQAFDTILAGHVVVTCRCSGCDIARTAHIWVRTQAITGGSGYEQ